jgi:hypothetical protein
MRRPLRFMLVTTAFALAALSAITVMAAPATWESVDVTLHSESDASVLLVSGDLPEPASLPADAELAVPAGSELQWIGEILGGPVAEDPELKYTKSTAGGVDVYRFTLTKARTAQIEIAKPGRLFDGSSYTSSLKWTSAQDIPLVTLRLRVPQGAQVATSAPGATMEAGSDGYAFYTKTIKNVKAGDELDLAASYTLPAAPAAAAGTPAASTSEAPVLAIFLLIIAGAAIALFVAARRKTTPANSELAAEAADEGQVSVADDGADEEPSPASGPAERPQGLTGPAKRKLVTGVIILALVLVAVIAGAQSTKPKLTGDTISTTFSPGEPCATATIPLEVKDGADPTATADKLFSALRPLGGMNVATYNYKTSSVEVGFCESSASESSIRAALASTGLVAQGGAPETAAP